MAPAAPLRRSQAFPQKPSVNRRRARREEAAASVRRIEWHRSTLGGPSNLSLTIPAPPYSVHGHRRAISPLPVLPDAHAVKAAAVFAEFLRTFRRADLRLQRVSGNPQRSALRPSFGNARALGSGHDGFPPSGFMSSAANESSRKLRSGSRWEARIQNGPRRQTVAGGDF